MNNLILRETLSKYSSDILSDLELISLILGEKIANNMKENEIYSLKKLVSYSDSEIKELIHITDITLSKIKALYELSIRNPIKESAESISSPKDIVRLSSDMEHLDQEVFRLYCLNTKNKVIKTINLFKGGINVAVVDVRIVFKEALKCNATQIVAVHNHPSGNPEASSEDKMITDRIRKSGDIMGIKLLDHVIIGSNNSYISLKEKGII